jgi:LPPG:FO 2-phospho-L-lactate transferase
VILLLSGGVGGAKLAEGLASLTERLAIIGNTGDDLEWCGLRVCPDLDIVMYTLAGIVDRERGWGLAGDTDHALEMLARYGHPAWFRMGDRDLATSLLRTTWLRSGLTLTEATEQLCRALSVRARLLPMSDDPVRTIVQTPGGELEFQEYFVARGARDVVTGVRFAGAERAAVPPVLTSFIETAELIVVAPSNPMVSIGPILAVPGMREAIRRSPAPKIGVSPLVGGLALKGPAAVMMRSLGHRADAAGVASLFRDVLDVFVIDEMDAALAADVRGLGMEVEIRHTIMTDIAEKRGLASDILRMGGITS